MLYVFWVISIFTLLIAYGFTRDFLSPAVLFPIPWILVTIILIFSEFDYDATSDAYLIFSVGLILFELGYFIVHNHIYVSQRLWSEEYKVGIRIGAYRIFATIELIFTIYLVCRYALFIVANQNGNIFLSFYSNRDSFDNLLGISYIRNIVLASTIFSMVIYMFVQEEQRQEYIGLLKLQVILGIICGLSRFTRNGILASLLPLLVAAMIVFKQSSKKILVVFSGAFIVFMIIFSYIAFSKYWYIFDDGSFIENMISQIADYTAAPLVAFQKVIDNNSYDKLNGANTFRFFIAIADRLMGTNNAVALEQSFISIGSGKTTNVYTFYYYFLCDYGVWYAFFMEFLVGMLHGSLYKRMSTKSPFAIYFFSLMMYPLLMQFFQDQYISLLSTWLQYFIIGFILFKTNLLIYSVRGGTNTS